MRPRVAAPALPTAGAAALLALLALQAREAPEPAPVPERPQRIVPLTLAATEMLLELVPRRRIAAVHAMAAVSRYSNVRERVAGLPRVSSDAGDMLASGPDLVVGASYTDRALTGLLARGRVGFRELPAPRSLEDVLRNLRLLGDWAGEPRRARRAVERLRGEIEAIRAAVPESAEPPRIVWLSSVDTVAGRGTVFDSLARLAGARNAAAERGRTGLAPVSVAELATWEFDVLVVGGDPDTGEILAPALRTEPARTLLRTRRVVVIPAPHLSCVSQYAVDALRDLVRALHPGARP